MAVEEKKTPCNVFAVDGEVPGKLNISAQAVIELHMNLKKLNWNTQTLSFLYFFTANTFIWALILVWNERRMCSFSCRLCPF